MLTLRTVLLFAVAAIASITFVAIGSEVREHEVDTLDTSIELAVHKLDSSFVDVVMTGATLIGSDPVMLTIVAIVTGLAIRRRRHAAAIILVIDTIVVVAANNLLKVMYSRERPMLFDKIALPTDYSFPSGHAMEAMGIGGVIAAVVIALYPRARATVIVTTSLFIFASGFSRIYLGVHWPADVLCGFLGGVPPLVVSVHLLHRSQRPSLDRSIADLVER